MAELREQTMLERYGAKNVFASEEGKRRIKETMLERYGVEKALQSASCQMKMQKTMLDRYGVENCMQSPEIQARVRTTMQERYGVEYALQSEDIKAKSQATCRQKYGVRFTLQSPEVQARSRETCLKKYGVEYYTQQPGFKDSVDWQEASRKRHETMKRNGTYGYVISGPEEKFYQWLVSVFGEVDIDRQVGVNGWFIDFYIGSLDTYVQFDGAYWHGLDRPMEVICEYKTPRDEQIHKKWMTDREQETWFQSQGLRLIRVVDRDFKRDQASVLLRLKDQNG